MAIYNVNKTTGDITETAGKYGSSSKVFYGNIDSWNNLTTEEKKEYDHASITDSIGGGITFPANKVVMTGGGNVEDAVANIGNDTDLGYVQGSGTITLADSVPNYRFIQILIGYYKFGYPCYGQALLPVSTLPIGIRDENAITISFTDRAGITSGKADILFLSATSAKVVNTSDSIYTRIVGIA